MKVRWVNEGKVNENEEIIHVFVNFATNEHVEKFQYPAT